MEIVPSPKISVSIFTYNSAKYVRECIESVLAQTLRPFEIIICDDHSFDGTWKIISEYSQRYPELIKSYRHGRNLGMPHNGNFSRKKVVGDLISEIDGDDCWLPQKLELEWKALQRHPEALIAYSNVYTIDDKGNRTGIWYDGKEPTPPSGDAFVEVFSRRFFSNSRSIFRNELVSRFAFDEESQGDENLESYWDWDRKIRYTARFPVAYSGNALVEYRIHGGGFHKHNPERHFRAMVKIYKKHLPLLEKRTAKEVTRVKCNIESLLALQQINLSLSDQLSYYSVRNVYERNRSSFNQLPKHDRVALETELLPIFTQFARQLVREEIKKGNRRAAFKYWLDFLRDNPKGFDFRLLTQLMLTQRAYQRLKDVYRSFRDVRR